MTSAAVPPTTECTTSPLRQGLHVAVAWVLLTLALQGVLSTVAAQGLGQARRLSLVSAQRQREYYLLVPASVPDELPAPVLLLLHGSYSTPLDILPQWREVATGAGLILVAPKSSAVYGWRIHEDSPDFFRDLIDEVARQRPIDRRRIYLFGHSAGAVHALTLGILESQYFAAVAVHAGAFTQQSSFNVLPLARRKIPLWIAVGDQDEQFPLSAVRQTETALRSAGFPLTLAILSGHDHTYLAPLSGRINRDAWTFLESLSLADAPLYQSYR